MSRAGADSDIVVRSSVVSEEVGLQFEIPPILDRLGAVRRQAALDGASSLADELRVLAVETAAGRSVGLEMGLGEGRALTLRPVLVDVLSADSVAVAGTANLRDGRVGWFSAAATGGHLVVEVVVVPDGGDQASAVVRVDSTGGDDKLRVLEIDPSALGNRTSLKDPLSRDGLDPAGSLVVPRFLPQALGVAAGTGGGGTPRIDLLVSYDSQAISEIASVEGISWGAARHKFVALSMTELSWTNLALQNSLVPARIKLVGYFQAPNWSPLPTCPWLPQPPDYVDNSILCAGPELDDPSDGRLDTVTQERDRLGADLVVFISDDEGAALASGFHTGQPNKANVAMDAGCFYACPLIYAHELGHNFGAGHNGQTGFSPYSEAKISPATEQATAVSAFDPSTNGNCPSCVRIPYYSNPSVWSDGWQTGSALADNARTIRDQMFAVSNYREQQTQYVGISSYTTNATKIWATTNFGDVVALGGAPFHGDPSESSSLLGSVVDIEDNDPWGGYWILTDEGQVKNYGAGHYGDPSGINLAQPVVAMSNSTYSGYWLVAADGGVFAYGSAGYWGSLPGSGIGTSSVVDIVARPQGDGYWILDSAGTVYSYGGASGYGSLSTVGVNVSDAVAIESDKYGTGYWILRATGQVYAFGTAPHRGNNAHLGMVEIDRFGTSNNYRLLREDGSISECTGSCSWL